MSDHGRMVNLSNRMDFLRRDKQTKDNKIADELAVTEMKERNRAYRVARLQIEEDNKKKLFGQELDTDFSEDETSNVMTQASEGYFEIGTPSGESELDQDLIGNDEIDFISTEGLAKKAIEILERDEDEEDAYEIGSSTLNQLKVSKEFTHKKNNEPIVKLSSEKKINQRITKTSTKSKKVKTTSNKRKKLDTEVVSSKNKKQKTAATEKLDGVPIITLEQEKGVESLPNPKIDRIGTTNVDIIPNDQTMPYRLNVPLDMIVTDPNLTCVLVEKINDQSVAINSLNQFIKMQAMAINDLIGFTKTIGKKLEFAIEMTGVALSETGAGESLFDAAITSMDDSCRPTKEEQMKFVNFLKMVEHKHANLSDDELTEEVKKYRKKRDENSSKPWITSDLKENN
jgi:hypothetical protein